MASNEFTEQPADAGVYRDGYLQLCPPWLLEDARLAYAQAVHRDVLAEWIRLGILQRFPGYTDDSGLAALGRDRVIYRGRSESSESYAERLRRFRTTWRLAGGAPELLRQLWATIGPDCVQIRYVANGYTGTTMASQFADWWTIDDSGLSFHRETPSNWDWDSDGATDASKNVRFWLIVYRSDVVARLWGDGPTSEWGEAGYRWGTADGPVDWIDDVRRAVRTYRAAGSSMGPWPGHAGGLIVANPDMVTAPWNANGVFYPESPPGYPMPDGDFDHMINRPPGAIFLTGV